MQMLTASAFIAQILASSMTITTSDLIAVRGDPPPVTATALQFPHRIQNLMDDGPRRSYRKGLEYFLRGDLKEAERWLRSAVWEDSDDKEARAFLERIVRLRALGRESDRDLNSRREASGRKSR